VPTVAASTGRNLDPELCDDDPHPLCLDEPELAACYAAAAQGISVAGERAGKPTLRLVMPQEMPSAHAPSTGDADYEVDEPAAEVRGVNLHAKQAVDDRDRKQLELLGERDDKSPGRHRWAWLLAHVPAADLDTCPRCAGPMRWADVATTRDAVFRLLATHGLGPGLPPETHGAPAPLGQLRLPLRARPFSVGSGGRVCARRSARDVSPLHGSNAVRSELRCVAAASLDGSRHGV